MAEPLPFARASWTKVYILRSGLGLKVLRVIRRGLGGMTWHTRIGDLGRFRRYPRVLGFRVSNPTLSFEDSLGFRGKLQSSPGFLRNERLRLLP